MPGNFEVSLKLFFFWRNNDVSLVRLLEIKIVVKALTDRLINQFEWHAKL